MRLWAGLVTLAICAAAAGDARAEQLWAEAGDRQLRQDVETLKAGKFIRGPIESWPLPWSQIIDGVEKAENADVPPFVEAAAARLRARSGIASQSTVYEVDIAGTNRPALVRDFGFTARNQADVALRVSNSLGNLHFNYGVGYRSNQIGPDYHFEPTDLALQFSNWAIYGGYTQKWWGPGNDGALVLSTDARPFPKVGITRLNPYKPRPKFLRWIGPWRVDFFGGVLTETRPDTKNPVEFGQRFSFEPGPGLEISIQRTLLVCGDPGTAPRPPAIANQVGGGKCGAGPVGRALFPFFGGIQPGDSLAGVSVSYTTMIGVAAAKIYYDADGEDKKGVLQFDQDGQTGGASLTFPAGRNGGTLQLYTEYTDTLARRLIPFKSFPGSYYGNSFYYTGKDYRGLPLGESIGGDSDLFTLSGAYTTPRNLRLYASYRQAHYNKTAVASASRSIDPEFIHTGTLGTEVPTQFGDVRLEGRVMDNDVNTPGRKPMRGEFEISFRSRF